MKIAMVSMHASPLAAIGGVDAGGQNIHVAALTETLAERGHRVTVYTRRDAADLRDEVMLRSGAYVVNITAGPADPIPMDELLPFAGVFGDELARHWRADPPDVVHAHFWMSGLASLQAVEALGTSRPPVVQNFHALGHVKRRHQGAADTSPAERATCEPDVGRRADRVIASCSDEAEELARMGVPTDRIRMVPCGVDAGLFHPAETASPSSTSATAEHMSAARFTVMAVGRLVPRKGIDVVIDALRLLQDDGIDDVDLVVVGGSEPVERVGADPNVQRLRAHADQRGVADRVVFRGQVPHPALPAVIRTADAVACTPWYEPFGIVPLEAMACGVPVIAADVGGLRDTVADHVTGLRVPPRDAVAVARAIAALRCEPEWARALGRNGPARVARCYTWDKVAADMEDVYVGVVKQNTAPRSQPSNAGRR